MATEVTTPRWTAAGRFGDLTLNLLRIVAAYLFWQHGAQKLLGWFTDRPPVPAAEYLTLRGIAGWLEFVGGLLLLLGLFTRPVAFLLAGEMAVAYWLVHVGGQGAPHSPLMNGGEAAVLYCFLWLFFAAVGPGSASLDAALRRRPGARFVVVDA